jgi:hypothetical protein
VSARRIAANIAKLPELLRQQHTLTGRSRDVRYGALRDHSFAAIVGRYRSDGRDNDSKGDKYPTNGVNLRRVFRIVSCRSVIETSTFTKRITD